MGRIVVTEYVSLDGVMDVNPKIKRLTRALRDSEARAQGIQK